ncbi:hypothetical protein Hanom_Chr17g01543341 [Helianthus anomalus]
MKKTKLFLILNQSSPGMFQAQDCCCVAQYLQAQDCCCVAQYLALSYIRMVI